MEQLEKVEKLRERADVSYEEAKEALEACDWDLLDAMVWLEKRGKVKGPTKESFTTSYEEQDQYVSVKDKVQEQEESGSDSFFKKLGHFLARSSFRKVWITLSMLIEGKRKSSMCLCGRWCSSFFSSGRS